MAKFVSQPAGKNLAPPNLPDEPEEFVMAEGLITGGMVTSIPPKSLQNTQLSFQKNFYTRYGRITRRAGSRLFTPAKPNSLKVLSFTAYAKNDGTVKLIRETPTTIHAVTASTWTAITPSAGALTGGANDRFTNTVIDDRLFSTNNGADAIQEINTVTNHYAPAGNAPKYKFNTGFGDRLVGGNLAGVAPNGVLVGWSGNKNYTEFDPTVDKTAGSQPLVDSSSDDADFISGVFGFANTMLIVRQRSIWEAAKTGSPTSPFNFYSKIPNLGSDAPYSIERVPAGLAWLDFRTRDVYVYGLDGSINRLASPIIKTLITQVDDPSTVFSSYNQTTREFIICLPTTTSSVVRAWIYSFEDKCWFYEEYEAISFVGDLDYNGGSLSIGELVGTIGQLQGTIGGLSPDTTAVTRFFGQPTGELLVTDANLDADNNVTYTADVQSKEFTVPDEQTLISRFRFQFTPLTSTGSFDIYYKKDNKAWVYMKTITWDVNDVGNDIMCAVRKTLNARKIFWRLLSTAGRFDITEYEVKASTEGESVRGQ